MEENMEENTCRTKTKLTNSTKPSPPGQNLSSHVGRPGTRLRQEPCCCHSPFHVDTR
jgi:hypothetical protein